MGARYHPVSAVRALVERWNLARFVLVGVQPCASTLRAFARAGLEVAFVSEVAAPLVSLHPLGVDVVAPVLCTTARAVPHHGDGPSSLPATESHGLGKNSSLSTYAPAWCSPWLAALHDTAAPASTSDADAAPRAPDASCIETHTCVCVVTSPDADGDAALGEEYWRGASALATRAARSGDAVLAVGSGAADTARPWTEWRLSWLGGHAGETGRTGARVAGFDCTWREFTSALLGTGLPTSFPVGTVHFGPHKLDVKQLAAAGRHSMVSVNLRPVLPGHILVLPRRRVPRLAQLTAEENAALWAMVQRIGDALSRLHGAHALTIAVQDGAAAGQTVPHVHVHIIPRHAKDIANNDEIYDQIDDRERELHATLSPAPAQHARAAIAVDPTGISDEDPPTPLGLRQPPAPRGVETQQLEAVVRASSHGSAADRRAARDIPAEADRKTRTPDEMAAEAASYRAAFADDSGVAWLEL